MALSGFFNRGKKPTPKQIGKLLLAEARKPAGEFDPRKAARLIADGADLTVGTTLGLSTALHLAAKNGHMGLARELLAKGALLDAVNIDNNTPLMEAVRAGHQGIALFLLGAGASPHVVNIDREAPLHAAVRRGDAAVVEALLGRGARTDQLNGTRHTPLVAAALAGRTDLVRMIMNAMDGEGAPAVPKPAAKQRPEAKPFRNPPFQL